MVWVAPEEFEAAVSAALDAVPAPLMDMLDNVVFFVEEEPPAEGRRHTCPLCDKAWPDHEFTDDDRVVC